MSVVRLGSRYFSIKDFSCRRLSGGGGIGSIEAGTNSKLTQPITLISCNFLLNLYVTIKQAVIMSTTSIHP